jgi:signal peptidase I
MILPPDNDHPAQEPGAPGADPAGDADQPAAADPAARRVDLPSAAPEDQAVHREQPAVPAQWPAVQPEDPPSEAADPIAAALMEEPAAPVDAAEVPPPPATRIARFRAWRYASIVEILGTVAVALLLAESVQAAVVKPFVIPSESMEPTLLPGQRVLVNRLAYDFGGSPQRGDIVVFHPSASLVCKVNVPVTEPCPQSTSTPSTQYFVKRVMGLPGDHLEIENGHPVINGKEIRKEPYITPCANSTSCDMPHVITVPPGEYYMLGDNRGDSDDSRYWGPVPKSWIIGEVFATYWPPDRIGIF